MSRPAVYPTTLPAHPRRFPQKGKPHRRPFIVVVGGDKNRMERGCTVALATALLVLLPMLLVLVLPPDLDTCEQESRQG